jgi:succinate dehydrogenase / fumarate reductase cytochrome b subunit
LLKLASLVLTVRETLRYRGSIGQWSWVLHRATGLGVVFFLVLHVIDTSWAVFYPGLYEKAIASYQSPLFTLGEFGLVFAVVYHALNGMRIAIFDNKPELWKHQEKAAWGVLIGTAVLLVPAFIVMISHVIKHYNLPNIYVMPLTEVLVEQLPFAVGIGVAFIVAIIASGIYGVVSGAPKVAGSAKSSGSRLERFWWSFMRLSGAAILPLVFGHLVMIHVLQGVFDLTLAGGHVVGVPSYGEAITLPSIEEAMQDEAVATQRQAALADFTTFQNGLNDSGTGTEFVAERWNYLLGGVAIWKLYDIALLALVTVHGFNGLRYVLTDYTQEYPILRRAMGYVCVMGAVVLLVVGGAALLGTIQPSAIQLAEESLRALRSAHGAG